MHASVWKIRVILLQTFVWIVDLKVREHLTEYLKKDIKYHRVCQVKCVSSFLHLFPQPSAV